MNPSDRRDFGNLLHAAVCAGSTGFCQVKRNAANDTNLDDLAMSEVSPLPESDTEFVAC
jgi:hypothetical protein